MTAPEYMTVTQAAENCNITPHALQQACWRGRLRAIKPGRDWLITQADLEQYLESRPDYYRERVSVAS